MLQAHVFGCGAAGNKAAIQLIEKGGYNSSYVSLLNSTLKDIPEKYKDQAIIFNGAQQSGGCGKERNLGKEMFLKALKSGSIDPDTLVQPNDDFAVVVGSTEGGSGSGSIPILAKYLSEVMHMTVVVILFFGFEDDIRGMQNSIELCQELSDKYAVQAISNKKFLDMHVNKIEAEKLANDEFIHRLKIMTGDMLNESSQNIDDTDLKKLISTTGYMDIIGIEGISFTSIAKYNDAVDEAIENGKSLDVSNKTAKRIGVMNLVSEKEISNLDLNYNEIKNYYGIPYEIFSHVQNSSTTRIDAIISGMDMPIDSIKQIYTSYIAESQKNKRGKDSFFDEVASMESSDELDMLGGNSTRRTSDKAKSAFFDSFGLGDKIDDNKKSKVIVVNGKDNSEY